MNYFYSSYEQELGKNHMLQNGYPWDIINLW
jgi:hypothetical protein